MTELCESSSPILADVDHVEVVVSYRHEPVSIPQPVDGSAVTSMNSSKNTTVADCDYELLSPTRFETMASRLRGIRMAPMSPLAATSDSNDSQEDARAPTKKRKPTYYARKDEKEALQKELVELERTVRELKAVEPLEGTSAIDKLVALNAVLSTDVEINDLLLAGAQSLMMNQLTEQMHHPLDHYIYLSADDKARRQALEAIKTLKLDAATRWIRHRTQFLDLRRPHRQCQSTVLDNGDFVLTFFDVTPFDGHSNVRHVYDQFLGFVTEQEISLSEQAGIITIRETDDCGESAVSQCRFLSSIPPDVEMESNSAMCHRFAESVDGKTPAYGIGAIDYVDRDDKYPYQATARLRKDMSGCCLITQTPPASSASVSGVSMVSFATLRLHRSQLSLSRKAEATARASLLQQCEVMNTVMLERLGLLGF